MVLIRRRLRLFHDEMKSIVADIVGTQTANDWWGQLDLAALSPQDSTTALRHINELITQQFGRGIAREVQGQLRPVIEEYRLIP
jgi:sigma-B regulation protein RsbU (phosphoserine phosphatase)